MNARLVGWDRAPVIQEVSRMTEMDARPAASRWATK